MPIPELILAFMLEAQSFRIIWAYPRLCFRRTEHIQREKPELKLCGIETKKLVMGKREGKRH